MSRNSGSHFAYNPQVDISRSTFDRSHSVKFSFNAGDLIPFYVDEVLPGDTFKVKTSKVVRLQPLVTPIMDTLYLDTYYFFVPNRLVWSHWRELNGENTASAWIPQVEYQVPQITAPPVIPPVGDDPGHLGGWDVGTIADYMGIPTGVAGLSVNALPIRAYALICNEWFRDENLLNPLSIPVTDATVAGVNTGTYVTDVAKGGLPYKASKYHDYFTSCLPSPQKGPDVELPLGGLAPVSTQADCITSVPAYGETAYPMPMLIHDGSRGLNPSTYASQAYAASHSGTSLGAIAPTNIAGNIGATMSPANLWADLSVATAATINQLRLAMQMQKLYERDARGGTRYIEILKSHFGVTSPDARLQRPEYLGGNRTRINVSQVLQQSATVSGSTPQGNPVGMSLTTDVNSDFNKSFVEHGFVVGICVCRYQHTYQQGLERLWSRHDRFDYYWPVFSSIGDQAIYNREIYAQGTSDDAEVFGYQEAWADYRYKPNRVAGEMRSAYATSLDVWHLADDYPSLPSLSSSWIMEDKSILDRVLAVTSSVSNQLIADMYINNMCTRPMPMYSIPGLIDHH